MKTVDTREDLPGAIEFNTINGLIWIHPSAVGAVQEDYPGASVPGNCFIVLRTGYSFLVKGRAQEVMKKLKWKIE